MKRLQVVLTAICFSICGMASEIVNDFYGLPVYKVDGFVYALNFEENATGDVIYRYPGAILLPNNDKQVKYSGKVIIPTKITVDNKDFPVVGFLWLSGYPENESNNLEIILPDGLKFIGGFITYQQSRRDIAAMPIPNTVEYIGAMAYIVPGTRVIPGSVKFMDYMAFFTADNLIIEDGVELCGPYALGCSNTVLTIPGTIKLASASLDAVNLKHLIIKKSANKDASPEFDDGFCARSYDLMAITCEYENPPKAHKNAFRLESSNFDPLYPYDNPDDPHGYDYHPTMCDRATLYVPKNAIEAYKTDNVWSQFERIRAIEDGIKDRPFLGLPTYTVGNLRYALNETARDSYNASIYKYTGAIVIPNDDKEVKYSGKITVPEKVTINGTEYPVFGFMWLSEYPENESSDLEISLPEGLKVIGFNRNFGGSHNTIKAINIPKTVEYIGAMKYVVPGATMTLPGTIKVVSAAAGIEAEKLIIEDGVQYIGTHIAEKKLIRCNNTELTIPGSVQFGSRAIETPKLESIKITKSKIDGATPYLGPGFCWNTTSVKKITCEYDVPPETSGSAFEDYMYDRATLYVPEEAIEAYKAATEWKKFKTIMPIKDGVSDVTTDDAQVVATEYHDLYGRRLEAPAERGITIRTDVYSDGTRRCTKILH
mgnify:FL=1